MRMLRALAVIAISILSSCMPKITFEEVPGQAPLKESRVTKWNGQVSEVFATLDSGVRITNVVDISFFDGLDHRMTPEAARQRFGEPQRVLMPPDTRLSASVYTVSKGEVGFLSVPTSGGSPHQPQVWAFPTDKSPDAVILDSSLRRQLVTLVPVDQPVRLHLCGSGSSGVTLGMTSNRVEYLILGPRDGE